MREFAGVLILFALVTMAFQAALMLLVVAGLIFRTKETLFLLLVGGLINLVSAYPAVGFGLLGLFIVMAIIKACRNDSTAAVAALKEHTQ